MFLCESDRTALVSVVPVEASYCEDCCEDCMLMPPKLWPCHGVEGLGPDANRRCSILLDAEPADRIKATQTNASADAIRMNADLLLRLSMSL